MKFTKPLFSLTLACLFWLTSAWATAAFAGEAKGKDGRAGRLEVMTQNLYVGADLFKIVVNPNPIAAATEIFGDIQSTDFWQRADAIADLVARKRPHLIGLQEVSLIRTQCPSDLYPPNGSPEPAEDVYADYLAILLEALTARGLHYEVAASVVNADVELPVFNDGLLEECLAPFFDARLTDHDVTLKRSDVEAGFSFSANFTAALPVPTPAGDIYFFRGYNVVDVELQGRSYRFVNTHLEVNGNLFAETFQTLQAEELVGTLLSLPGAVTDDRIIVAVGDFNSDSAFGAEHLCVVDPVTPIIIPCPTPYTIMGQAGFIDTWTVRNGAPDPGYTCCQSDLLDNTYSDLDQRIDHIWVRPPLAGAQGPNFLNAVHADVVGERQKDRSIDGLWPSDHAGVVAGMTFRQKK